MTAPDATDVADRLHSVAIHLLRRVRTQDDASGLTAARLSALSVLVFGGPHRVGDLARTEQVTSPTMTRIVADLEAEGLVSRARTDDGRVSLVAATRKGTKVLHDGRRRRVAALAGDLERLPARDLATLRRAAAILEALQRRV